MIDTLPVVQLVHGVVGQIVLVSYRHNIIVRLGLYFHIMQYSNLKNEEVAEEKMEDNVEEKVDVRNGIKTTQDVLVKKEACWFIAMVLTFILIGSVVFYVTHSGGIFLFI